MKADIVRYLRKELPRRGLSAYWIPGEDGGVYVVHLNGRAVMNFSITQFYQIPKLARNRMWAPLVRTGLAQNLGETSARDQVHLPRKIGLKIV